MFLLLVFGTSQDMKGSMGYRFFVKVDGRKGTEVQNIEKEPRCPIIYNLLRLRVVLLLRNFMVDL